MAKKEEKPFRCARTERPSKCPKCGGDSTFDDNEESDDWYEILRIRCDKCDFAWLEYFRYEHWEPLEEAEE